MKHTAESPFRNTRIRESELHQDIPLERLQAAAAAHLRREALLNRA